MTSIFENELADMYQEYVIFRSEHLAKYPKSKIKIGFEDLCKIILDNYSPNDLPDYKHIESYSDEIGESCYSVFSWKGVYYRIPYSYRSHEGIYYYGNGSDIEKVEPVMKQVRVWE